MRQGLAEGISSQRPTAAAAPRRPQGGTSQGRQAKLDELLHAPKDFIYYLDSYEDATGREVEYLKKYGPRHRSWTGLEWCREMMTATRKRSFPLQAQCETDSIF